MVHCVLAMALWTRPSDTSGLIMHSTNNSPLCGNDTFSSSTHQLMDMWFVSTRWLLWIMLL